MSGDERGTANGIDLVQQHFWRNYLAHVVEGGLYMGGMAFVAADTVMPAMMRSLGGPNWLIACTPMLAGLGFSWLPILTAHWVERLSYVKSFIISVGVFQRLPFLVAAGALFFLAESHPHLTLAAVALAPFLSGTVGGISYTAWLELISKVIPANRRASSWALRFIIGSSIGIGAGGVIRTVLRDHPGHTGYGMLELILFGFLALSFVVFFLIRETGPNPVSDEPPRTLQDNLLSLPQLLAADRRLMDFVRVRFLTLGIFVMTPFLAIHALTTLGKPESFLGLLVTCQMSGAICGNLMAGYIGDRFGGKSLLVASRVLLTGVCVAAGLAHSEGAFLALFFAYGVALHTDAVGNTTISLELCPEGKRPTYMALLAAVAFGGMLAASGLSTLVRNLSADLRPAATLAAVCVAASLFFVLRIPEPRKAR
jgi:MFS family permease